MLPDISDTPLQDAARRSRDRAGVASPDGLSTGTALETLRDLVHAANDARAKSWVDVETTRTFLRALHDAEALLNVASSREQQ